MKVFTIAALATHADGSFSLTAFAIARNSKAEAIKHAREQVAAQDPAQVRIAIACAEIVPAWLSEIVAKLRRSK